MNATTAPADLNTMISPSERCINPSDPAVGSAVADAVRYDDGTFVLIESIKNLPIHSTEIPDGMLILVYCTKGHMQADFMGRTHRISEGDAVICTSRLVPENSMISPDFDAIIFGLKSSDLQLRSVCRGKDLYSLITYTRDHPVHHLDDNEQQLLKHYYAIVRLKLAQPDAPFHADVMHSLFNTILYEICAVRANHNEVLEDDNVGLHRGDYLFRRFLELLQKDGQHERSVTTYARKLNVSPKYLTTVVKNASGYTTLQWIHRNTAELVAHQLKYTDLSIKEIAYSLDFSNLSFFGKFCKAHLGCSPKTFRNRLVYGKGRKERDGE